MKPLLAGIAVIAAAAAHAEPPAAVRVSDHSGFGRVVFEVPDSSPFQLAQRGNHVFLTFSGAGSIGMPESVPRNVISVLGGYRFATLTIAPGARIRSAQTGNRVVVDVLDPAPRPRAACPLYPCAGRDCPSRGRAAPGPCAPART